MSTSRNLADGPAAAARLGGTRQGQPSVRARTQPPQHRPAPLCVRVLQAPRAARAGGHLVPRLNADTVYESPLSLDRTGPYGYTVRVLPAHRLLASGAEPGLVAVPSGDVVEGAGVLKR